MNLTLFLLIPIVLLTSCTLVLPDSNVVIPTPTPLRLNATATPPSLSVSATIPPSPPPTLPSSYLIETAFVPQAPQKKWDQPWQDACEEAALLTVHYYYQSQKPDLNQMLFDYQNIFKFESDQGWGHDVDLNQLAQVAQSLGYRSQIIENPTITQLKTFVAAGTPVIVPANGKTLFKENKHFKGGGPWYHQLVILGYDDQFQKFIVHDVGTQFGAYFKYSYDLLFTSIHDWPPSGLKEDINLGRKAVLVLLK